MTRAEKLIAGGAFLLFVGNLILRWRDWQARRAASRLFPADAMQHDYSRWIENLPADAPQAKHWHGVDWVQLD